MQVQPITNSPVFNGKVRFMSLDGQEDLDLTIKFRKYFDRFEWLIKHKDYDVFVYPAQENPNFYIVDANTSFDKVLSEKGGKVKIYKNSTDAIVSAVRDAIKTFDRKWAFLKYRT